MKRPNLSSLSASAARRSRASSSDRRGVSAVEFAMLLPLMVTLYLGSVEISQGVGIDRKVTLTSRTVGRPGLAGVEHHQRRHDQYPQCGVRRWSRPTTLTKLKVTVSEVTIDANGNAKVVWSDTLNGTKRSVGSTVTLPTALTVANTSLIWSEALRLQADDRLRGHRHAHAVRPDLHAPAARPTRAPRDP